MTISRNDGIRNDNTCLEGREVRLESASPLSQRHPSFPQLLGPSTYVLTCSDKIQHIYERRGVFWDRTTGQGPRDPNILGDMFTPFNLEPPNSAGVTQCGERGVLLQCQACPIPGARHPRDFTFFWYLLHTPTRYVTQQPNFAW